MLIIIRSLRLKSLIEFTGNLAEAYMGVVVVLGLVLLVMFASQGLISGSGAFSLSNDSIMQSFLFSSVLIPIISVAFIGILHMSQPREPFGYSKPDLLFLAFLPFLPIAVFLPNIIELLPIDQNLFEGISNGFLISISILNNISLDDIVNYISILSLLKIRRYLSQ